jgi:hypothetical protein
MLSRIETIGALLFVAAFLALWAGPGLFRHWTRAAPPVRLGERSTYRHRGPLGPRLAVNAVGLCGLAAAVYFAANFAN